MKTTRLKVLTTPAFRDWLRKEARNAGVSVAELVRTRCERKPTGEEQAVAKLAADCTRKSAEHKRRSEAAWSKLVRFWRNLERTANVGIWRSAGECPDSIRESYSGGAKTHRRGTPRR